MSRGGFFTIDEVIEATGFDRRTIAYYVQQGLLPKVGRRGRLTRYPQEVVDRLLFIKLLREAEESGRRPVPMTLAEIGDALDRIPAKELHAVANGIRPFSAADRFLDPHDEVLAEPLASGPPPEMWETELERRSGLVPRARRRDLMLDETGEPDLFIARMRPEAGLRESRFRMARVFSLDDDDESKEHEVEASDKSPSYRAQEDAETGPPDDDLETLLTQLGRLTARRPPDRGAAESWTRVAITPGLELAARDLDRSTRALLDRIAKLLRRKLGDSFNRR